MLVSNMTDLRHLTPHPMIAEIEKKLSFRHHLATSSLYTRSMVGSQSGLFKTSFFALSTAKSETINKIYILFTYTGIQPVLCLSSLPSYNFIDAAVKLA